MNLAYTSEVSHSLLPCQSLRHHFIDTFTQVCILHSDITLIRLEWQLVVKKVKSRQCMGSFFRPVIRRSVDVTVSVKTAERI